MALVPAICTQCGAQIEVDNTHEAGVCKYCGTAFITEKVINNYVVNNTIKVENASINISGVNVENLLKRSLEFERAGNIDKALEYYNRVLDEDIDNPIARAHIKDIETPKGIDISGVLIPVDQGNEIIECLNRGEKVKAIKAFREATGCGLKEAKDAIELYETKYHNNLQKNTTVNDNIREHSANTKNVSSSTKSSGGCYIATCVYGSYDCPEVWILRRFRDFTLSKTWYGRAFIKGYYVISPILVKWFGDQKWFRLFWKNRLDLMISNLKGKGFKDDPYHDNIFSARVH